MTGTTSCCRSNLTILLIKGVTLPFCTVTIEAGGMRFICLVGILDDEILRKIKSML
jgi:hypothetical protein